MITINDRRKVTNWQALSSLKYLNLNYTLMLILGIIGFSIGKTLFYNRFDDMFITYRYAYNLATGNGFVYNIGERYLGTTAPLFGFIIGLLGIPNPDAIPAIAGIIGIVSLMLCGSGIWMYGVHINQRLTGFLAAIFFMMSPLVMYAFSSELVVQTAFLTWAFVCYQRSYRTTSAVLLALATLTRFDSILIVGLIAGYEIVSKRRIPWREILIFTAILTPVLLTMWAYYGQPIPGTLDAKKAQGESGLWMLFFDGARQWTSAILFQDSSQIFRLPAAPRIIRMIPLVLLGFISLFRFGYRWWLPLAWAVAFTIVYSLLKISFFHWYVIPAAYGFAILAALGVELLVKIGVWAIQRFRMVKRGRLYWMLSVLCVLALTPGLIEQYSAMQAYGKSAQNTHPYIELGKWLRNNTEPEASIGYIEIGFVGYYSQRTIIDSLGLVNPNVAPAIARKDLAWSYQHYRPDYIVHYPGFFAGYLDTFLEQSWFQEEYRREDTMDIGAYHFDIYHRVQ